MKSFLRGASARAIVPGLALAGLLLSACDLETVSTDVGTRTLDAAGIRDLWIDVEAGRLDVVGEPDLDAIEVEATMVTYAFQDVDDARGNLVYRLDRQADRALLRVDLDDEVGWVDVTVRVPSRLVLEVDDDSGDLEIRDVAALRLVDQSGDVVLRQIAGELIVDDDSGDLDIEGVGGDVRVTDDSGEIRLSRVGGRVEILDDSGDLMVSDVDGPVRITDGSGSIRVERVEARVEIVDGSGDITLIDTPDAWIIEDDGGEVFRR